MTCKDCLHYECCHNEIAYGMGSDDITGKYFTDIETRCKHFKNKADFTEVRRSEWERPVLINGYWCRRCKACLYSSPCGDASNKDFKPAFCSNCGAKMEG